jgi:hypothetical protein
MRILAVPEAVVPEKAKEPTLGEIELKAPPVVPAEAELLLYTPPEGVPRAKIARGGEPTEREAGEVGRKLRLAGMAKGETRTV